MHKNILVRCNDLEELHNIMERFDENAEVEEYVVKTKAELIQDIRDNIDHESARLPAPFADVDPSTLDEDTMKSYDYINMALNGKKLEDVTDEDLYEFYRTKISIPGEDQFDADGNLVSMCNPQGRWDYWTIGGRWEGKFIDNEGDKTDAVKICDIDWDQTTEPSKETREYVANCWRKQVEGKPIDPIYDKEHGAFFPTKEYLLERYGDEDGYLHAQTIFNAGAIVCKDENGDYIWHDDDTEFFDRNNVKEEDMHNFSADSTYLKELNRAEAQWDDEFLHKFILNGDQNDFLISIDIHY